MGSMERMKSQALFVALACIVTASVPLGAQTFHEISLKVLHEKPIQPATIKAPFDFNSPDSKLDRTIEFRPASQMSDRDRDVAANSERAIAENSRYTGLEFNTGN